MTENQKVTAALALRAIAARAQLLAQAVERGQLWPGELSEGVQQIHADLAKVPHERR